MYVSINCLGLSVKLTSVVIDNVEDVIPILIQNINGKLHWYWPQSLVLFCVLMIAFFHEETSFLHKGGGRGRGILQSFQWRG